MWSWADFHNGVTFDVICVTDNVDEFKRIPALKVENWLR